MKINKEKLKIEMARNCMTTKDLQITSGLPRGTLNNAICGRNVSTATIGKISKALNIDVIELLEK